MTTVATPRQAVLFLSLTVFLWGIPALFIHYFALHLDAPTQNFWRYASALLFLALYARWTGRRPAFAGRGGWTRTALAGATLVVYQTCFTGSLYFGKPAFIVLLMQLELIVAILLSCLVFADERGVVRSPWFVVGACAALAGGAGIVVFHREFAVESSAAGTENLLLGVGLVGGAAVCWGIYSVAIKWCLEVLPPFTAFLRVEAIATLLLFVVALTAGSPAEPLQLPRETRLPVCALLFFSGIACIAVAHICYTRALHRLGVAVCNTVILATAVVAAVGSRLVFDEHLTALQIVSAAVLLGGAAAAIHAGSTARRRLALSVNSA